MPIYSKGEILRDAQVLEHSSFKCFQDREQIKLYCFYVFQK